MRSPKKNEDAVDPPIFNARKTTKFMILLAILEPKAT